MDGQIDGWTDGWMETVVYLLSVGMTALIMELRLQWFVSLLRLAVTVLPKPSYYIVTTISALTLCPPNLQRSAAVPP